jgi:hypothetical protein
MCTTLQQHLILLIVGSQFPGGGPGRGGVWWNEPNYWLGILLGIGLAVPLFNAYKRKREDEKARLPVCMHHAMCA